MKLDKWDVGLAKLCPKEGRLVLQSICVRDGTLTVADGFVLLVRKADLAPGETMPETLLPATILTTIKASQTRVPNVTCNNDVVTITTKTALNEPLEFEPSLSFKPKDGTYPEYDQVFPVAEKKAQIAFSVGILRKVLGCLPADGIIQFGINGEMDVAEFAVMNIERPIRGMIMPMLTSWDDFRWYKAQAVQKKEEVK